jgi:hypothetical protein
MIRPTLVTSNAPAPRCADWRDAAASARRTRHLLGAAETILGVVSIAVGMTMFLDRTSLGSDDVCIALFVRPHEAPESWVWSVQLSLVGSYGVVARIGDSRAPWPITEFTDEPTEGRLLAMLGRSGVELLSYAELREQTGLRAPNSETEEIYTVYNALFTDMDPFPRTCRATAGKSTAHAKPNLGPVSTGVCVLVRPDPKLPGQMFGSHAPKREPRSGGLLQ